MDHVAGYACGHDVSARDWQKDKPGGQWLLGKSFDGFAPLGPELVTADEVRPFTVAVRGELWIDGVSGQAHDAQASGGGSRSGYSTRTSSTKIQAGPPDPLCQIGQVRKLSVSTRT